MRVCFAEFIIITIFWCVCVCLSLSLFYKQTKPLGMPQSPLKLLNRMRKQIRKLTSQLVQKLDDMQDDRDFDLDQYWLKGESNWAKQRFSPSVSAIAPRGSWNFDECLSDSEKNSTPCSGESIQLMYARWKKLEKDLYSERKVTQQRIAPERYEHIFFSCRPSFSL